MALGLQALRWAGTGNTDDNKDELVTLAGVPLSTTYPSLFLSRKVYTLNGKILKRNSSCRAGKARGTSAFSLLLPCWFSLTGHIAFARESPVLTAPPCG